MFVEEIMTEVKKNCCSGNLLHLAANVQSDDSLLAESLFFLLPYLALTLVCR